MESGSVPRGAVDLVDLPREERENVRWILDESFSGLYALHARRTLHRVNAVRVARLGGRAIGIAMVEKLTPSVGYVCYLAVAREHRNRGIGGTLLDDALSSFREAEVQEVYAAVEDENVSSDRLFRSRGFQQVDRAEFARRYGHWRAAGLRVRMMVVPGEILYWKKMAIAATARE